MPVTPTTVVFDPQNVGGSGDWSDVGEWFTGNGYTTALGQLPDANDAVALQGNTVSFDANATIYNLTGGGDGDGDYYSATLNMTGGSLTIVGVDNGGVVINVGAAASLKAGAGAYLTLNEGGAIAGTLGGSGHLEAENVTLESGAQLLVANLDLSGTLDSSLSYGGAYSSNNGGLDLNNYVFTLTGTANLDDAFTGSGTVLIDTKSAELTTSVSTVSSGATMEIETSVNQDGDQNLNGGAIQVDAHATYTISTASDITGGSGNSFVNNGSLIDNSGGGTSSISVPLTNNGALTIDSGDTFGIAGPQQTLGGLINGAGVLALDTALTLAAASVKVRFLQIAGDVTLGANLNYAGQLTNSGTLDLDDWTLTLSGASNELDDTILGGDIKVTGTASVGNLYLGIIEGSNLAAAVSLDDAGTITQDTGISINGALTIDVGKTYTLTTAVTLDAAYASTTITNNGLLTDADATGGTSTIVGDFNNNGTLAIDANDTLVVDGGGTLAGTIKGAGTLELSGSPTVTSSNLEVASLIVQSGWGMSLGADIVYAGNFTTYGSITLNGHTLTLSGGAVTFGASNNTGLFGVGVVKITGAAVIDNPLIWNNGAGPGTAELEDAGKITQTGQVTLLQNSEIQIDAGATYTLDAALIIGGNANGIVVNNGAFVDADGSDGTSTVTQSFTNAGTLTVDSGDTLDLEGTTTLGGKIGGGGVLNLDGWTTQTGNLTISGSTTVKIAEYGPYTGNEGIYDITGDFSIVGGAIVNEGGLFEKTGGSATSNITASFTNTSGSSYVNGSLEGTVSVSSGETLSFSGASNSMNGFLGGLGTIAFAGGTTTLVAAVSVAYFQETGAKTIIDLAESLDYSGGFSQGAGSTLSIGGGDALTLTGTSNLSGKLTGGGALALAGGAATIGAGAKFSVASSSISGAGTIVTLATNLSWGGALTQNAGSLVSINAGGALTVTGTSSLAGTIGGAGALDLAGASATLNVGAAIDVADWSNTSLGTTSIAENLTYAGTFFTGAARTLAIADVDVLTLTGTSTLNGAIGGAGALVLAGGATTISAMAALSVASWSISGAGTGAYVEKSLTYSGVFAEGAGSTLSIAGGDMLTLKGAANLSGSVTGSGTLALNGATTFSGGAGWNVIAPNIFDAGGITVTGGSFDLVGGLTGPGAVTIGGGSTVQVDGLVGSAPVFAFVASGGELALDDLDIAGAQLFHGSVAGFGAADAIDAGTPFGAGTTLAFNENKTNTSGTLTLMDGTAQASITFLGNYSAANFVTTIDGHGGTLLTYHG